jgi:hypothetical protein
MESATRRGGVETYMCMDRAFPWLHKHPGSARSATLLCATIDFLGSLFTSVFRSSSSSFLNPHYSTSTIAPALSSYQPASDLLCPRPVVRDVADRGWLVGRTSCCMAWPRAPICPPRVTIRQCSQLLVVLLTRIGELSLSLGDAMALALALAMAKMPLP